MIFEEDVPDAMLLLYINLPGRIYPLFHQ